ncbi:VOC family protein [Paraglaciecola sp. 2405UD69-4]|uniref:VOC family protein n=1 Tax=Paraglaciecola sp. 2405UD69-4 TaxID=3391836 RepID=UPI0039C9DC62
MSKIQSIHHLNFVVRELEPQIDYFRRLLQTEPVIEELPLRQVKTARFNLSGVWIVLVQPLSTEGEVAEILSTHGEGLFLLSLGVESLEQSMEMLSQKGIHAKPKGKRPGLDNWIVQDLDCPQGLGPVLQLCQLNF